MTTRKNLLPIHTDSNTIPPSPPLENESKTRLVYFFIKIISPSHSTPNIKQATTGAWRASDVNQNQPQTCALHPPAKKNAKENLLQTLTQNHEGREGGKEGGRGRGGGNTPTRNEKAYATRFYLSLPHRPAPPADVIPGPTGQIESPQHLATKHINTPHNKQRRIGTKQKEVSFGSR